MQVRNCASFAWGFTALGGLPHDRCVFLLAVTLTTHHLCLAEKPTGRVRCQYFPAVDKVLFVDDYAVGCRKDLNGILLLDTALQGPVTKPEDVIQLELPVTEVGHASSKLLHLSGRCALWASLLPSSVLLCTATVFVESLLIIVAKP